MLFNFFKKWLKLDQMLAMPVMPVGASRIIDIADVSASQGALHYGYAMPVMPAGGDCIMDIAQIANV